MTFTVAFAADKGHFGFDEPLARVLAAFPDVQIIVHSTWRKHLRNRDLRMLLGPLGPAFSGITNPHERDRHKAIVECVEHLGEADYRILEYDIRAFPAYYRELIACHPERGAWTRRYCDSFMPGARSTPEG